MKVLGVILLVLALLAPGCGAMRTGYAAPFDRTWEATLAAMREMNMTVYRTEKDAKAGTIYATEPDGTQVKAKVEQLGTGVTEARIRVGITGDDRVSRQLHDRIQARLER